MLDIFNLFNRLGRIGMGCGAAGFAAGTLAVLGATIVGGIAAGAPAWAIVLICLLVLLFTGGMVAVSFFAFRWALGPEVARRKLLERGEDAEAGILKVTETGVTVNKIYPVAKVLLEVRPRGRPPYQVETRMVINRLDVPQVQPGAVVPVKIDPRSRKRVAIVMPGEATALTGTAPMDAKAAEEMLVRVDAANEALLQTGTPAQAKVLQAQPLGIEVNGPNPAMRYRLEVYPPDRPSFQAEATGIVAQASIPKYQPGKMVFVKFDPADITKVTLDHS